MKVVSAGSRGTLIAILVLPLVLASTAREAHAISEADRLWQVGASAFADGLYPTARDVLERFVGRYPLDSRVPEAWLMLGKARLQLGQLPLALDAFRLTRTFVPPPGGTQETQFWEGETLSRLKRYREARAAWEALLASNAASPFAADAVYGLGWLDLEQKRLEPAVRIFRRFLDTWPEDPRVPDVSFVLARTLVDLKRYAEAEPGLERFLADHPEATHAIDARFLLGWTRLHGGRTAEGIADLRAFVETNPGHGLARPARRLIAETLLEQGDDRAMVEECRRLLGEAPPAAESLYEAWTIAGRLGREPEREAAVRRLQQQFPRHPLTHRVLLELASAAFKEERYERAATLARSVATSPDDGVRAQGFLLIGETELRRQRHAAALAAFTSALATGDGELRARARAGNARTYEEQQQWTAALALYREIAGDSADRALRQWAAERAAAIPAARRRAEERAALGEARAALSRKSWGDALKHARVAARSSESAVRAEGLVLAGEAELKRKRYAAALRAFQAAVAAPDVDPALQFRALAGSGVAEEARRQWSKALDHYEKVAAGSPDADLAQWAVTRTKTIRAYQTSPTKKTPAKSASRRIVRR